MKRLVHALMLVVLAACGDDAILPGGGPADVTFRAISERQNAALCVRGPAFALAMDADEWKAIWERKNECQPGDASALPPLLATEAGVAAWWRVEGCLGSGVKTKRITSNGPVITVAATVESPPAEFCASAIGGLESFLALDASAVRAVQRIRFVLDDTEVGSLDVPS
ncbi:MAG: hypothetical protein ACRDKS_01085 [Actinomycetota bacterium]